MKPMNIEGGNATKRKQEKKDFAFKIGDHLKKLRESRKISQEDLSNSAGYYHTYANKIEKGKYSPSLHTIWRLAHSLGMTLEQFFKGF